MDVVANDDLVGCCCFSVFVVVEDVGPMDVAY